MGGYRSGAGDQDKKHKTALFYIDKYEESTTLEKKKNEVEL